MRIKFELVTILALLTSTALASAATGNNAVALGITYQRVGNTSSYESTSTFEFWTADTAVHNYSYKLEHWRGGQLIAVANSPQLTSQGITICTPCEGVCTPINGCIIEKCSGGACLDVPADCVGQGPCQYSGGYVCNCKEKPKKHKTIWDILFGDVLEASVTFQGDVNPENDLQTLTVGQLP